MVKQYKIDEVEELKARLKEQGNVILTDFSGVKVNEISLLRKQLAEKGAKYKVVKNTLFRRALEESGYVNIDEHLKGPIGVAFAGDQVGEVAKILKEFAEKNEKFTYFAGILENVVYGKEQIKKVADLPTKEVLLSQTMSLINGPARQIASGMNQIMASLARGIKAVAEAKNN
ncbi:MAG TPA: 50S ribosomal protein L10 [Spirochaetota bacterium]|nr:50S ribosomal protein L10 [Spirochaetota bacterium]HPP96163.1 50S ribosomal protein L10 [Spirochaetota bacterium]